MLGIRIEGGNEHIASRFLLGESLVVGAQLELELAAWSLVWTSRSLQELWGFGHNDETGRGGDIKLLGISIGGFFKGGNS